MPNNNDSPYYRSEISKYAGRYTFGTDLIVDLRMRAHEAREKHPTNEALLAALIEEVGELARAIRAESWRRIYDEAIDVAVVALRIAQEGDGTLRRSEDCE